MVNDNELSAATESHRRAGHLWRFLSLAQIPLTFFLIFYFIVRYLGADTIVDVPDSRTLEETKTSGIPDKEYINVAQNIVNLIGTFQPTTARDQFETARDFMLDSALPNYDETQMNQELITAEESDSSQILYVEGTNVSRQKDGAAKVCIGGYRQRIVAQAALPQQEVTYCFVLKPDEPFAENPFGLMVAEFSQKLGPEQRAQIPKKKEPVFEKPKDRKKQQTSRRRAIMK